MTYSFQTLTGQVVFDYEKCRQCDSKTCIAACTPAVLHERDGLPVLAIDEEQARKGKCIECLACELACQFEGAGGLTIVLPIAGLDRVS